MATCRVLAQYENTSVLLCIGRESNNFTVILLPLSADYFVMPTYVICYMIKSVSYFFEKFTQDTFQNSGSIA